MGSLTPARGRRSHFLDGVLVGDRRYGLQIERSGQWLASLLEFALDSTTRRRGLLERERLEWGTGLVIAPTQGIHTFGMRFPIDVVGVSREGRVVKVRESVQPQRVVLAWRAFAIVELPSGATLASGLRLGDRLLLSESTFDSGTAPNNRRCESHAPGRD